MNAIVDLSRLPGVWRGGDLDHAVPPGCPTGFPLLDAELPGGGLPRGGLTEILHDGVGIGEVSLLLGALRQLAVEGRVIAWINPPHLPYAPALASAGVPLDACLVVRPASAEDALWSTDQALRSGACGAALFWLPEKTDYVWLRRLQMAAEAGRSLAVLFRPTAAASLATPAHLRVLVTHRDGRLLVSLPKRRGPPLHRTIAISIPGRPVLRRCNAWLDSRLRGNDGADMPRHSSEVPCHSSEVTRHSHEVTRHSSEVPCHSSEVTRHSHEVTRHSRAGGNPAEDTLAAQAIARHAARVPA